MGTDTKTLESKPGLPECPSPTSETYPTKSAVMALLMPLRQACSGGSMAAAENAGVGELGRFMRIGKPKAGLGSRVRVP